MEVIKGLHVRLLDERGNEIEYLPTTSSRPVLTLDAMMQRNLSGISVTPGHRSTVAIEIDGDELPYYSADGIQLTVALGSLEGEPGASITTHSRYISLPEQWSGQFQIAGIPRWISRNSLPTFSPLIPRYARKQ